MAMPCARLKKESTIHFPFGVLVMTSGSGILNLCQATNTVSKTL